MAGQIRKLIAERITADQAGYTPWKDVFDKIAWSVKVKPVSKKTRIGEPQFHLYYKELQNMGAVKVYTIDLLKHWANMIPQADKHDPIAKIHGENTGLAIHIKPSFLKQLVLEDIMEKGMTYGIDSSIHKYRENRKLRIEENPQNQNIVVEFSSPNIAKEFHAGHLRSTLLGNFIGNISSALGHGVTRINYLGDWGTQFGLLGVGFQKYGSSLQMHLNPVKHLYEVYVKINKDAKDDNGNFTQVFHEGIEYFNRLEKGDSECYTFWEQCRQHSIDEFQQMYKRLGVDFDEYHGESMYDRRSLDAVSLLKKLGVAHVDKATDVTYIPIKPEGSKEAAFHAPILKSNGSTLYLTRDISALLDRHERYNFDRMLYVVEKGQSRHFEALVGTMKQMGKNWADRPVTDFHVQFGRVEGMSSRKGTIVLLKDILDEAKSIMLENMKNTDTTRITDPEGMESVADVLGKSAIIIQDLKERRIKNYKFSWKRMSQFKGDTGVFLQYTHARLCSLQEKSGLSVSVECDISALTEESASALIHHLSRYDEILHQSYLELDPYHLTHYLLLLCRLTNVSFKELRVQGEPNDLARARLLLFHCSRTVLASGLQILGVQPLEKL